MICGMIQSRSHRRGALQSVMWKRLVDRIAAITATSMIAAVAAVVLSAVIFGGPAACAAQAKADTIDVPQLRPGMKGHGMTVFSGAQPESFDVEVIGIVRRGGQLGDMILVRVSGAVVEAAGGVAEGMSGSPVYVDGKLAGAIAYVFPGSDHFVAGVTPIADMLRMLDYPDALGTRAPGYLGPRYPDAFRYPGRPGRPREVPGGARAAASVCGERPVRAGSGAAVEGSEQLERRSDRQSALALGPPRRRGRADRVGDSRSPWQGDQAGSAIALHLHRATWRSPHSAQ